MATNLPIDGTTPYYTFTANGVTGFENLTGTFFIRGIFKSFCWDGNIPLHMRSAWGYVVWKSNRCVFSNENFKTFRWNGYSRNWKNTWIFFFFLHAYGHASMKINSYLKKSDTCFQFSPLKFQSSIFIILLVKADLSI